MHDIGHPPFGHAGERKLDERMREHGERFDHNLHALRIVEKFEQRYLEFPGLNLTYEVREGIIKHSRDYKPAEYPELAEYLLERRPTLEAQLIDLVDEIAYNTADLDDGFEAHLVDIAELRENVPLLGAKYAEVESQISARTPEADLQRSAEASARLSRHRPDRKHAPPCRSRRRDFRRRRSPPSHAPRGIFKDRRNRKTRS